MDYAKEEEGWSIMQRSFSDLAKPPTVRLVDVVFGAFVRR